MKRGTGLSSVGLCAADGAGRRVGVRRLAPYRGQLRAEIRNEIREAMRDAQRARFRARRDVSCEAFARAIAGNGSGQSTTRAAGPFVPHGMRAGGSATRRRRSWWY